MPTWPHDDQTSLIKFYGDPGKGEVAKQLVRVTPPFQMYYAGRPLKTISFHKKAAPALIAALNEIWEHYGRDQKTLDRLGISDCGGTYNPRKVLGASVGDYIDAVEGPNDTIIGAVSSVRSENTVGRVRRILEDGRASIVVSLS